MTDEHEEHRGVGKARGIGLGVSASILLHVVFAFILFFHLPLDVAEPQKDESVSVEIVPPPEEEKAEEKKAEEPEKKAEEQKPPEPPKAEEAKKEEPPPPPPEPPKEEAKKEEPPPPPPPPKTEEAKQNEAPGEKEGRPQPVPVLREVHQFGEKDTGPRKSAEGDTAQESATPPEQTEPDVAEVKPPTPVEEKPEAVAEAPPANPVPDDVNVPEIAIVSSNPQQNGPVKGTAPDALRMEIITAPPPVEAAKAEPRKTPTQDNAPKLDEAKKLFSRDMTNDPVAMTAMGNLPRDLRAGELCSTELKAQLRSASYWPEFLPSLRLPSGTTIDKSTSFRTRGDWYDVSLRCEVDEGATKVLSFAFKVGGIVPRSEWKKRRFPVF
ncbi:DUF930 domain-containing protein [Rhizobium sp. XQZ8]|uniref:DUF930 domain-containing protein n=1 Tax=Rhizobium populisoli TaxID=2859785 RepID=UPI001CA5DFD0|nr:DUF930 domain-containing protein [Rhizobium populisoli]MBW6422938.1 DUF930 domain-containing protein [Rhizobium populisoli]